jgi:hypothetical protein
MNIIQLIKVVVSAPFIPPQPDLWREVRNGSELSRHAYRWGEH